MRGRFSAQMVVTLTLLVIGVTNGVWATQPYHWSARLTRYEYKVTPFYSSAVAASDDTVAVDVGKILMFDASEGRLRTTCDPWPGREPWGIWSVAGGNFLAYFGRLAQDTGREGPMLLLISPACEQLKTILLPGPSFRENATWSLLLSPTGRTLLLSWSDKDGRGYQLRDAGTLGLRRQWFEPKSNAPDITAVSDRGFLGMVPIRESDGSFSPGFQNTIWYRTFDGEWKRLSVLGYLRISFRCQVRGCWSVESLPMESGLDCSDHQRSRRHRTYVEDSQRLLVPCVPVLRYFAGR